MGSGNWMIYGANGFTGELIAKAAVKRGHQPILSGRSFEKITAIAESFNLEALAFAIDDPGRLIDNLAGIDLVLNAAGPFVHTALPLVWACLASGSSYLDISGEVTAIEEIFTLHQRAREKGISIIPGVGFNVLASDCLVLYTVEKIVDPAHLDIATQWATGYLSPGSTRTMYENFPVGILARRGGQLVRIGARDGPRRQRFLDGEYPILPANLGDLVTAYQTTGIPNITTYTAFNEQSAKSYSLMEPVLRRLFSWSFVRRLASKRVENPTSPSEHHLPGGKTSQVWVSARNEEGEENQSWLETVDSYLFTAEAAVRSVEKVISTDRAGVYTPALAFGADFIMEIPGTKRADGLEDLQKGDGPIPAML